jgi:hypothetical protein
VKRATTILDIPQATEPTPLTGDELNTFYVPADRARDSMRPPTSVLRDCLRQTEVPLKLLFASHPGAGKSTELNRLMAEQSDVFLFARFSITEALDLCNITHIDLILALMETLYQIGREEKLIRDKRVIEPVRNWLQEVAVESQVKRKEDLAAEAKVGLDGLLAQIIGLQASLRSAFSLSHESAKTVRQVLRPRIAELRGYCNQVITEITRHLKRQGRRLVIIVEDTDKLDVDVARDIFVKHTGILADIGASVIYTAPLFLIHSPDRKRLRSRFETLTLPMIKTYTPQGERVSEGWDTLREIVTRRLDVENLIDSDALELVIEKTGGVLRDLLAVIREASTVAHYQKAPRVSTEAMRYALDRLKADYRTSIQGTSGISTEDLYKLMVRIAQASAKQVPVDEALMLLLYTQAVVEYNGRGWYDLHPLMRETLIEMEYLDGLAR